MTGTLPAMPPAQAQAWQLLIRLDQAQVPWVLIGGQMMMLLCAEHQVLLPRPTLDADVLVDVRARPGGLEVLARWLAGEGFELAGVSPDNIGHCFARPANPLLEDPLAARQSLTKSDRRHLRVLSGLLNGENPAWAALPPHRRRLGQATARLLLATSAAR